MNTLTLTLTELLAMQPCWNHPDVVDLYERVVPNYADSADPGFTALDLLKLPYTDVPANDKLWVLTEGGFLKDTATREALSKFMLDQVVGPLAPVIQEQALRDAVAAATTPEARDALGDKLLTLDIDVLGYDHARANGRRVARAAASVLYQDTATGYGMFCEESPLSDFAGPEKICEFLRAHFEQVTA